MTYLYFKLFSNCIPVKGTSRCLIADLQRNDFYFIPEGIYEIFTIHKNKTIAEIKSIYNNEFDDSIDIFLNDLDKNELGFWCDNPQNFPDLSLKYRSPSIITNAIVEYSGNNSFDIDEIFQELTSLNCYFVEIRFKKLINFQSIETILKKTKNSTFRNIELLLPFYEEHLSFDFKSFLNNNQRVGNICIYKAPLDKKMEFNTLASVVFTTQDLSSNRHCGQIHPNYFVLNIPTFTESQHHNTCLNRKISIDQNGNIKNCPSMSESYGNIKDTTLEEALNHPDFKKYWNIKKDQISVCQDCEFRHICTDCRAYLENPDACPDLLGDIYSKPLKCLPRGLGGGYNPYTCEWEDWSTNPLKEKAIKHYGMTTM